MREQDMRERVQRFLQTRLRTMLAPATLGLGLSGLVLTTTGCPSDGLDANDDGGALVKKDVAPDQQMVALYMAPLPPDSGILQGDGGRDQVATKYLAPIPDAGLEMQPEYMAPMPDASQGDLGSVMRYMAPMPDAAPDNGRVIALYMAQLPLPRS